MKAISRVYIEHSENPRVILNTLLATLFSSSAATPNKYMNKELKVTISVQTKKDIKNEKK